MSGDRCTAFQGTTRIASGPLAEVAAKVKRIVDTGELSTILIFDDVTAQPVEVDFRGSVDDVIARLTKLIRINPCRAVRATRAGAPQAWRRRPRSHAPAAALGMARAAAGRCVGRFAQTRR